jgi:hypothetical protein
MSIEVGQIVQTNKYARDKYPGRKLLVQKIQSDIEDQYFQVIGPFLDRKGYPQKKNTNR